MKRSTKIPLLLGAGLLAMGSPALAQGSHAEYVNRPLRHPDGRHQRLSRVP